MSLPLAPSTSLTAVSAATTPSSPGLNSGTRFKCTEPTFRRLESKTMAVKRTSREGRTLRWLVIVPIVGAVLDDLAYVVLIAGQPEHPPDIFTVPFVAAFIALMAGLLALSLGGSPLAVRLRPALRAGGQPA